MIKIFKGNSYNLLFYIPMGIGLSEFSIRSESSMVWNCVKILLLFVYFYTFIRMAHKYKKFFIVTDSEIIKAGLIRDETMKISNIEGLKVLESGIVITSITGKDLDISFNGINKCIQEEIISYLKVNIE